jgi:hypothetical protein
MREIKTLLVIIFILSCSINSKNDLKSIINEEVKWRGSIPGYLSSFSDFNDLIGSQEIVTKYKKIKLSSFLNDWYINNNLENCKIKIIDTEKIIKPYHSLNKPYPNGCKFDTTIIFTEFINKKKYILIPDYFDSEDWGVFNTQINIFELINPKSKYSKSRIDFQLPFWNLKIGGLIDKNKIDSSIILKNWGKNKTKEKHQFIKDDKSIEITTIEFENTNKLLITSISKNNLSENDFIEFVNYIKRKYPFLTIKENIEKHENVTETKYSIYYYGLKLEFKKMNLNSYNFHMTDCYTISKKIIENEGKKIIDESFKFIR